MAYITNILLAISEPTGLWHTILNWIDSWVFSAGWTIVLFTVFIRLILFPLDFYGKYITRKNNFIQKRLTPQVNQINKKYATRKDIANQQISALYKKEGYNMIGSCLFMLINMVLTLVIFFTFLNALRDMSYYKMLNQYNNLHETYYSTLNNTNSELEAEQAVVLKYNEINDSFLWIKNIWKADTSTSVIPTYEELKKSINNSKNDEYKGYLESVAADYDIVTKPLQTKYSGMWNGYYILAIVAAITSFLSQVLSEKSNKSKHEKELLKNNNTDNQTMAQNSTMKILKFILPVIMVIFLITNTASFGVYIVVSNIIMMLLSTIINIFVIKLTHKEEQEYIKVLEKINKNKSKQKYQEIIKKPTIQPGVKL